MTKISFYDREKLFFKDRKDFRKWLEKNYQNSTGFWMIINKQNSNEKSISYDEAVDEALCFGWIDSLANKYNSESYLQYFAPRKPKSPWSRINKNKIEKLIKANLMTSAGLDKIEQSKKDGSWNIYDDVEDLKFPQEFIEEINKNKIAKNNFEKFPDSSKKGILWWIISAKTFETKTKRINQTIELAEKNLRAR